MERYTLKELSEIKGNWKEAVVVFTKDSFYREYSETERSYKIRNDAKYFDSNMNGTSLFGNCLDGTDDGVRLDNYMHSGEGKWVVDYCYILKKCPMCKENDLGEEGSNALSRKDNDTEICDDCGTQEAMESYGAN